MKERDIQRFSYECLLDLATEEGINASGRDEVFGCIFGRDSALTILKMLNVYAKTHDQYLLSISKRALQTLLNLQGKEENIESGEEPGKIIHEFRKDKYEHLLKVEKPWFIYENGWLKNYDSVDSTPLALLAIYNYIHVSGEHAFFKDNFKAIELSLKWIMSYADKDGDLLLEYEFKPERKFGGLSIHSWTDSHEALLQQDGSFPLYPIATVEVQGYAWLALKLWSEYLTYVEIESYVEKLSVELFAQELALYADRLKERFNDVFLTKDRGLWFASQALDGKKNQINTVTGNPLILLWSSYVKDGKREAIVGDEILEQFVQRGFMDDLFDPEGGLRTMSSTSATYNPNQDSYHNGSFWPILNGLVHEGLEKYGFVEEAQRLKEASLKAVHFFGSPIELYIKGTNNGYLLYKSPSGQESCRNQAWSAASILDMVT